MALVRDTFCSIFPAPRSNLSPQETLEFANIHLENARQLKNPNLISMLCVDADAALSRIKRPVRKRLVISQNIDDQALCNGIFTVYLEQGKLLEGLGYHDKAQASFNKAEKWRHVQDADGELALSGIPDQSNPKTKGKSIRRDIARISPKIFSQNVTKPVVKHPLPKSDERIASTPQLAYCLRLLSRAPLTSRLVMDLGDQLDESQRAWIQEKAGDADEQKRLHSLATKLVLAFIRDDLKDPSTVIEIVHLAPVLEFERYRKLLGSFIDGIVQSTLLDFNLLEGLAQLLQNAAQGHLLANDLTDILNVLSKRLEYAHQQPTQHLHQLTMAVSRVLDAMVDINLEGLSRVQLHTFLSDYFNNLKNGSDPYLMYQAAYAYQALQHVPDDETPLQAVLRRTRAILDGASGLASSIKNLDFSGLLDGLGQIHDGAMEILDFGQTTIEEVSSLVKAGVGFVDSLREGLSFSRQRAWYPALRIADTLLRDGRFADFKKLVCEAPCRRDPEFEWGLCQRLGEIASNPLWDVKTRQSAIKFLGEIHKNDADWSQKSDIKQWIRAILIQLVDLPESAVKSRVHAALRKLEKEGNPGKQALDHADTNIFPCLTPLKVYLPSLASPSLINHVQDIPDVEDDLSKLRKERLKERGNDVHIPPLAKASLQAPNNVPFPLMENVKEFLKSDRKVLLLLGESGAGKSTFIRELECHLWDDYKKGRSRIPLHIHLPTIHRPDQDLIPKHLRRSGFTDLQIREMKHHREFILICDGYDESRQSHNLYTSNQLNQPWQWQAKMVISCRTECLPEEYKSRFQPVGQDHITVPRDFQQAVIAPFSEIQIQDYVKLYVSLNKPQWRTKDYMDAIYHVPNLSELVRNPFLLRLSLDVLPRVVNLEQTQDLTESRITRVELYDQFIEHWLEREKNRVGGNGLSEQARVAFESLVDGGFTQSGIHFMKELATAIYKEHGGHPVVEYSRVRDYGTWKKAFFSREDEIHLLRAACPLIRNGNQYRFIHRSLLEYCFALAVFDPQKSKTLGSSISPVRRMSTSSKLSFERQVALANSLVRSQQPVVDHPLIWRSFVDEPSILYFLAERVQQEPHFEQELLAMIERSKTDKEGRTAAANALSILVRAGIRFNGVDLRGIKIPGANLNGGQFDSALLQGADLRKVNFRNVWLRQANLSDARMEGVQFGEWPFLTEDSEVNSCAYTPDGKTCVVGLNNGTISVYDTTTWTRTITSSDQGSNITSMAYSPSGQQIALSSEDKTVRLWNTQTDAPGPILSGHKGFVTSVVYSPSGKQIASGSHDMTVRLWDAQTGAPGPILNGHTDNINNVVYSPNGDLIASTSDDNSIRLWDTQTGNPGPVLIGHTNSVTNMVFSTRRQQVASGSFDRTVRLWDTRNGTPGPILIGHIKEVTIVTYSPSGHQIASGSFDGTVRLWDTQTGAPGPILHGHKNTVTSVMYSPNGQQIASGSHDKTVRLWNAQTGAPGPILCGHTDYVTTVVYSPVRQQIASGSLDRTVRLWDTQTGAIGPIISGHTDNIKSVVYSPNGKQIASGSDDQTVRLWDAQTGAPGSNLPGHTGIVTSVAYSPSGDRIVSGSHDETVRLWDAQTGTSVLILSGHTGIVTSVVYSPSGKQIASGSHDKTVRLWDAQTGIPGPLLTGHSDYVTSVVYSPNGHRIASGSHDVTVRLWDAQTGAPGPILTGHSDYITSVVYSPSGHQIASGSHDKKVRLWDAQTGAIGPVLSGHTGGILSVVYSPSGQQIASGSQDKTVRLWDVDSGQCLEVIQGCEGSINSIAWNVTPNDTYFATGCDDKSVRVWRVMEKKGHHLVHLQWSSICDRPIVSHTNIQKSQGLSRIIIRLLEQRGAVGKPIPPLGIRGASEKIIRMASVVSQLGVQSRRNNLNTYPVTNTPGRQPARQNASQLALEHGSYSKKINDSVTHQKDTVYGKDTEDLTRGIGSFTTVGNDRDSPRVNPTTAGCTVMATKGVKGRPQEHKELQGRQQEHNEHKLGLQELKDIWKEQSMQQHELYEKQQQSVQELRTDIAQLKDYLSILSTTRLATIGDNDRDSPGVKPTTASYTIATTEELEGRPQEHKELQGRQQERNGEYKLGPQELTDIWKEQSMQQHELYEKQQQGVQELKMEIAQLKDYLSTFSATKL